MSYVRLGSDEKKEQLKAAKEAAKARQGSGGGGAVQGSGISLPVVGVAVGAGLLIGTAIYQAVKKK